MYYISRLPVSHFLNAFDLPRFLILEYNPNNVSLLDGTHNHWEFADRYYAHHSEPLKSEEFEEGIILIEFSGSMERRIPFAIKCILIKTFLY